MEGRVITSPEQVTAAWLTKALKKNGALTGGRVVSFSAETGGGSWSRHARLALRYSPEASGEQPVHLFLKLVDTDTGGGEFFLPAEVTTYTRDYLDVPDAPLLRCYDAAYDAAIHRYHLLLEDVTETHTDARDVVPTLDFGLALAEGLAALHARYWGAAGLAGLGAAIHDPAHIRRFGDIGRPGIEPVNIYFAADLEPHWPALIEEIFDHLPGRLVRRAGDDSGFTLIHCDPNPGNIMVPRAGIRPLYLIDCQPFDWSLIHWLAAYDLAYLMVLYWEPDIRRSLEQPLLHRYLAELERRGVSGYSHEQLFDDYRLCAALCVTVAVEYLRGGGQPQWPEFNRGLLRRSLTACEDLDCWELWKR